MENGIRVLSALVGCLLPFQTTFAAEGLKIGWSDLLPPGEIPARQRIRSTPSTASSDAALAAGLEGRTVELSGYLLPADREGDLVYSFMLVPRRGACAHMTQPPPAQVVRVVPEKPYKLSMNYEPVSITGELTVGLEKTQLFILDGVAVVESGYQMSMAQVARTDPRNAGGAPATPWARLENRKGP